MAQSGSRFHASRKDRTASGFAKEYIIWKPWLKNAWASLLVDEIGRANVPRPVLKTSIGSMYRSSNEGDGGVCACADDAPARHPAAARHALRRRARMIIV